MKKTNELTIEQIIELRKKVLDAKSCFGICSDTKDNKHIIMVDFDGTSYINVYSTLYNLVNENNLSTMYIIESKNGFNAFSLTKMKLYDIEKMLKKYKHIDRMFIKLAVEKRGFFVLRIGNDKKYLSAIPSYNKENLSYAHYLFYSDVMNYPIYNNGSYDKFKELKIIAYKSLKHGIVNLKNKMNMTINDIQKNFDK